MNWCQISLRSLKRQEDNTICGLVGVAGTVTAKHEAAFRELLIVDVIRGPHSTGIAAVCRNKGGISVVKHPLLPTDLFTMEASKRIFQVDNQVLIGHNRWATKGAINGVNAHPFEMEGLVGAHNGTLYNQSLLPDCKDFEVDSKNIFHSIQKLGVDDTYKLIHGAAALVWYKPEDLTLNFLRNKDRPLFLTYTKDRKTLFWASESWMLEGVLAKNGIDHTDIYDTVVHTHYTVRIPQKAGKKPNMTFDKVEAKVLVPYVLPKKTQMYPTTRGTTNVRRFPNGRMDTRTHGMTNTGMSFGKGIGADLTGYEIGEEVTFYLDPSCDKTQRFIDCIDSTNHRHIVRVYCHKNSWIRSALESINASHKLYGGRCNGFLTVLSGNGVLCQGNSVYEIVGGESEEEKPEQLELSEFTLEEFSFNDRVHQRGVLLRANNTCGICDNKNVAPHPRNYCLSDKDIICHGCRGTDFAKELINDY